jgi:hypothetical protein
MGIVITCLLVASWLYFPITAALLSACQLAVTNLSAVGFYSIKLVSDNPIAAVIIYSWLPEVGIANFF